MQGHVNTMQVKQNRLYKSHSINPDPFEKMQQAVDIVNNSPHPSNKIAAYLFGQDYEKKPFSFGSTNFWPDGILKKIGKEKRIGSASGTVHAETACIMNTPITENGEIYITDPFCPNCAKNIAEAGITRIYIDHKGFEKDFASRRIEFFKSISLPVCDKSSIEVYQIWRKDKKLELLSKTSVNLHAENENEYIEIIEAHGEFFSFVSEKMETIKDKAFVAGTGTDLNGKKIFILAMDGPVYGFPANIPHCIEGNKRYDFILSPANRILTRTARYGIKLNKDSLFSSRIPTSRELVNLAGADIKNIVIGNFDQARDENCSKAMHQLQDNGIMLFTKLQNL